MRTFESSRRYRFPSMSPDPAELFRFKAGELFNVARIRGTDEPHEVRCARWIRDMTPGR